MAHCTRQVSPFMSVLPGRHGFPLTADSYPMGKIPGSLQAFGLQARAGGTRPTSAHRRVGGAASEVADAAASELYPDAQPTVQVPPYGRLKFAPQLPLNSRPAARTRLRSEQLLGRHSSCGMVRSPTSQLYKETARGKNPALHWTEQRAPLSRRLPGMHGVVVEPGTTFVGNLSGITQPLVVHWRDGTSSSSSSTQPQPKAVVPDT